ncbi:hypothetical protein MKW98_015045 [Papaver atlanticum]|uniref:Uncharacterized protein n=1 Tax=Papaver atlanticum TaxID=357466 RepID=A0AAD4X8W3_9MAGN|nr:hypothetical protein MKW98_015045 [Papaver atlanticum]
MWLPSPLNQQQPLAIRTFYDKRTSQEVSGDARGVTSKQGLPTGIISSRPSYLLLCRGLLKTCTYLFLAETMRRSSVLNGQKFLDIEVILQQRQLFGEPYGTVYKLPTLSSTQQAKM